MKKRSKGSKEATEKRKKNRREDGEGKTHPSQNARRSVRRVARGHFVGMKTKRNLQGLPETSAFLEDFHGASSFASGEEAAKCVLILGRELEKIRRGGGPTAYRN